jgi:Domain of unknown function (DUF6265)
MLPLGYAAVLIGLVAGPADSPPSLDALAWMAGGWVMTQNGTCTEERWTRPAGDGLVGVSRTVANGRTRSFEFMRIEARSDGVFFVAQPGGRPPVDFKLTSISGSEIVFVNSGNGDHLKRIAYRRAGPAELTARIEGEDGSKPFAVDYAYRKSDEGCGMQ